MKLEGRIALVTGGAKGIGAGIVRRFIETGARVMIADVDDATGEALQEEIGAAAGFVHLDVASREAWEHAIAATEAAFGPLNVLVNNAGIGRLTYVESFTQPDWDAVLAVNQTGTLLGMQTAIPSLRRGGHGAIINISSLQGIEVDVGLTAYAASKFAVRGITKCAALELARDGIRANSIHPGMIRTPALGGDYLPDDFYGQIPLNRRDRKDRAGYPEDVGNLALFLASDDAAYVTAAEFVIDGGKSIRFALPGNQAAAIAPNAAAALGASGVRTVAIRGDGDVAAAIARRLSAEGAETVDGAAGQPADALVCIASAGSGFGDSLAALERISQAIRSIAPSLRQRGGPIVLVAPPMGTEAEAGLAGYATLAAALRGLTRALAIELGSDGVRVNLVLPGVIAEPGATGSFVGLNGAGLLPLHRGGDAGRRLGTADDIAAAVCFLASPRAGYITGTEFVVDGGLSQCRNGVTSRAHDAGEGFPMGKQGWPPPPREARD